MKFTEALDRKLEEVKRPPVPPAGDYKMQIVKHPETDSRQSREGRSYDVVTFIAQLVEPVEVDEDELEAFGNITNEQLRKQFLFFEDAEEKDVERSLYNLKRFLGHCGIDAEGMTLGEALAESVNTQFIGEVKHRPDQNDPEIVYAEIGRTAQV